MRVVHCKQFKGTDREVHCPKGGFTSIRVLLKQDKMGFTLTETTIYKKAGWQHWYYKNHLEACYCVSGEAHLRNVLTDQLFLLEPGSVYILDKHDPHEFRALTETCVLVCVFNPPLKGKEIHRLDGSYEK